MNDTTTKAARPADIHEAQGPLANAGAILETLMRGAEPKLSMTLQVVLRELYDGMERCQQLDIDTRKAQAAAAPAASTAAPAPADTQPGTAASVAADLVPKFNRLPAKQREAVIAVMQSIVQDTTTASTSDTMATEQASTVEWPACLHVMEEAANRIDTLAATAECLGGAFREDTGTPRASGAAAAEGISEQLRDVKRLLMDALNVELKALRARRKEAAA